MYPRLSAGFLFSGRLFHVAEFLNPLDDIVLSPAAGAFGDVERLRESAVGGVGFLPDGTHADAEYGSDLGVRQK